MSEVSLSSVEDIPDNLAEILPVGMIAGGGIAALAMAAVANRKFLAAQPAEQQNSGWQAFHYERISATEFEITGGVADPSSGGKKFHGAHDTVIITEAEVLAEMQLMVPQVATRPAANAIAVLAQPVNTIQGTNTANVLKVIFTLPDDELGRQRILRAFQLQADFFGAKVQACSLHDTSLLKLD
ncbi:hypothetical protein ACO0LD_10055 [Undibacterium sp. Ji83W]|uniref:hypothetical protein n=1 Tax=Undibacterium sp. Ji83W TaxID=3413043 RepID=UPI003BF2B8CA